MAQNLIIVESPAKAKTIEKYLGSEYEVIASMGHLRDLPKKTMGVDIENNFTPKYQIMPERKDLVKKLSQLAKEADRVYLATDPDREGEAISWHIATLLNIDEKDPCRVTFNEITKTAVTEAMKAPRAIDLDLVDAQQARRVLDRIVGYKLSPFLWKKIRKGLSAGRVQSVTVRMICDREDEINRFVPEEYWTLDAEFLTKDKKKLVSRFYGKNGKKFDIKNAEVASMVANELKSSDITVKSVKKTVKKRQAFPPYSTSTLQQDASRKLNFTSRKTMSVAQTLYEGVEVAGKGLLGLITYMRTDSLRVSQDAIAAAKEYTIANIGKEYYPDKPNVYKKKGANTQDAHEAIRPTYIDLEPDQIKGSLTNDQYKLYKLIWNRFLSSQLKPALFDVITVEVEANGESAVYNFRSSAQNMTFDGCMKFYLSPDEEEDDKVKIPPVADGDPLTLSKLKDKQNFTTPPSRYTEASLIKALEEKGIGRPSTYAPTIFTVLSREYIEKEGKALKPTSLGTLVTDVMKKSFANIVDEKFTATMEEELDGIESGKYWKDVLGAFYKDFQKELSQADETVEKTPEVTDVLCDKCGANMVIKSGKFGKFLACPNYPDCKTTKPLIKEIENIACPKCGNKLLERKSRTGKIFYGCEKYPECDFASWDKPTGKTCEKCGSYMIVKKYQRGGKEYCSNEACELSAPKPKVKTEKATKTTKATKTAKKTTTKTTKTTKKTGQKKSEKE
ncbi:MAG: type I DNA topoisomerase [Clostridia bacterium]|nr:type I DNA topoisomerase [Clostridia bacterium]